MARTNRESLRPGQGYPSAKEGVRFMALSSRVDQRVVRKVCGGVLSAALHVVLLLIILSGGRQNGIDAGDTPISKLILIEAPRADHREGDDLPPLTAAVETLRSEELDEALARLAPPPTDAIDPHGDDLAMPQAAPVEVPQPFAMPATEIPSTFVLSNPEMAALARRLEQLAEKALEAAQSEVTWEQDGKQYTAVLIRERANDGTALERVIAQVSASDRGRHMTTLVNPQASRVLAIHADGRSMGSHGAAA